MDSYPDSVVHPIARAIGVDGMLGRWEFDLAPDTLESTPVMLVRAGVAGGTGGYEAGFFVLTGPPTDPRVIWRALAAYSQAPVGDTSNTFGIRACLFRAGSGSLGYAVVSDSVPGAKAILSGNLADYMTESLVQRPGYYDFRSSRLSWHADTDSALQLACGSSGS
jgi:hypothetical protein